MEFGRGFNKEKVQPGRLHFQNQKPKFMNQKSLAQNINPLKLSGIEISDLYFAYKNNMP
jgi:hypothetical protein